MWNTVLVICGVTAASWLLYIGGQFAVLELYRVLFRILYARVSEEYAEPVSFWTTLTLIFTGAGYIVSLALL